jgi:hypothetical protein
MSTLTWDSANFQECRVARRTYQRLREEGYQCSQDGKPVTVFDPDLGKAVFTKMRNRYDRLLEDGDGDDCFDS